MADLALLVFRFLALIEGVKLHAYPDSGGVWTIGFGHTRGVRSGDTCTYDQALEWFREDIAPLLPYVSGRPIIQAAMLVSFGFNCGLFAMKQVITGAYKVTPEGFIQSNGRPYGVTSGGKPVTGLDNRRKFEAAMLIAAGFSN